jgi:hypothetical protein
MIASTPAWAPAVSPSWPPLVPDTPTAPTTSLPSITGTPPPSGTALGVLRSSARGVPALVASRHSMDFILNLFAVNALRSARPIL